MAITRYPAATNRTVDFNSSGTWTCPSGVYSINALVVGAGGGGGGCKTPAVGDYCAGGGGGGGAVKYITLSVTPGTTYTITIGAGGAGGSATVNPYGNNGGSSEILNGATSLIKAFGGQGAAGLTTSTVQTPIVSKTIGGGGGYSVRLTAEPAYAGGGGGAAYYADPNPSNTRLGGVEGAVGKLTSSAATSASAFISFGGMGIDGYGAAGGGGAATTNTTLMCSAGGSVLAGNGAQVAAAGSTTGSNATANSGCGGGGAATFLSTTAVAGGNGADGLVRITYFG